VNLYNLRYAEDSEKKQQQIGSHSRRQAAS